ncbi:hypothetical protein BOTBODRAFT_137276 [Botryobasidium botryosum FD-172 SS1]|uniref:Cytochrome P450 n=1 Tax=Botryobasidium botryosum (strain FD-172 SS1) TaxID=930990 RepID=A0A067MDN6_BOTB1|nr:hypothetical protein BOTBODRAFT_137276 [Botryobasidium botryosum FD-172 SS1]
MLPFPNLLLGAFIAFFLYLLGSLYRRHQEALRSIDNFPGVRAVFDHTSAIGHLAQYLPIPGLVASRPRRWMQKYKPFQDSGWDAYSQTSVLPDTRVIFSIADAEAIKEIAQNKATFPKPAFTILALYGSNLLVAGEEEAKHHRKIAAPAFSERNNKLVWQETARIIDEIFAEWGEKDTISVRSAVDITYPLALHVISAAAFGRPISWKENVRAGVSKDEASSGHVLGYHDAVVTLCRNIFVKLLVPSWALGWTKRGRTARLAYDEVEQYLSEMIASRRAEGEALRTDENGGSYKSDVLSNLIAASDAELASGKRALTERELMGNVFIFLFAGHETTAHTLAFALGLLACYPEEQDKLYTHIKSVLPDGRLPNYEDMNTLTRTLAVFYETARLFPSVPQIQKYAARDTTLSIHASHPAGTDGNRAERTEQRTTVFIPQNTMILIDAVGLHYNPRYWKDPHEFQPDRFMSGDWNRDALMAFSAGSRSCLGRRFSETEAVAALTMIVLRYKIELNRELFPIISGETPMMTRERLLKVGHDITILPVNLPLTFRRRA